MSQNKQLFVKVRKDNQIKYVKIEKYIDFDTEQITNDDALFSILNSFEISATCVENLQFKDRDGVIINNDILLPIIKQYAQSNWFMIDIFPGWPILNGSNYQRDNRDSIQTQKFDFVEMPVEMPENDDLNASLLQLDSESLKSYLKLNRCGNIFREYAATDTLTDNTRRLFVRESVKYLTNICGPLPKREEKIALAKSSIILFPSFKLEDSEIGGYDLFYHPTKHSGYIVSQLKTVNTRLHKTEGTYSIKRPRSSTSTSKDESLSTRDLNFFENCNGFKDVEKIKEKLIETQIIRLKEFTKSEEIFHNFSFFFVNPELILFEFESRYKNSSLNLLIEWPKYAEVMDDILMETTGKDLDIFGEWDHFTRSFICLLKLLPSTARGVKSKEMKRLNFEETVSRLLHYESSFGDIENIKKFYKPTIIASGENSMEILQYYLSINNRIIIMPKNYNFIQAFDLFFKSLYIFNIQFEISLIPFLKYLSIFIYKIDTKPTTRQIEINLKFQNKFQKTNNNNRNNDNTVDQKLQNLYEINI